MPNMSGYELAAKVRKDYPHVKLHLVSGFADDHRHDTRVSELHRNILRKPYTSSMLLTCVRDRLDEDEETDALRGYTFLIMDDGDDARELYRLNLERLGCNTILCRDGDEAVALYEASMQKGGSVDAVLVDITIPGGIGGEEVKDLILEMDPDAKIIVASGDTANPMMAEYWKYGFKGAFDKNLNQMMLKQALEKVLL